MPESQSQSQSQAQGAGAQKVRRACDRCKRQKLKCDVERPCTLCVRSGLVCTATDLANASHSHSQGRRREERRGKARGSKSRSHRYPTVLNRNLPSSSTASCPTPDHLFEPSQNPDNFAISAVPSEDEASDQDTSGKTTEDTATGPKTYVFPTVDLGKALSNDNSSAHDAAAASYRDSDSGPLPSEGNLITIQRGFTGDSSAMGLTKEVFSFNNSESRSITSAIPGGKPYPADHMNDATIPWLPPKPVVRALIDSYFDTVHWFMLVVHEISFREDAERIVSQPPDLLRSCSVGKQDFISLLMMVIAMGAQYAAKNPSWEHHSLVKSHSVNLEDLAGNLIRQVRARLFDSLERCQIEVVQSCILLGTFYMYHGKPSLSWTILGIAVKCAYALAMHREVEWRGSVAALQTRKRAWAHSFIADTFAAAIYGRPLTIDRAFCDVSFPDECDDTEIHEPLHSRLQALNGGVPITKLTFHTYKYRLYDFKTQILKKIFSLQARKAFSSTNGIQKLIQSVRTLDARLRMWHESLPPLLKSIMSKNSEKDILSSVQFADPHEAEQAMRLIRHLFLQAITLHVTYDDILILLHRPLLEYKMSSHKDASVQGAPKNTDPFIYSFNVCMAAALRISKTPANKLEYDMPLALICMHMFTAGVILCIPATINPFSYLAHEAKGGVVRIIRMHKRVTRQTPVAQQSCSLLEELMKVVLKRELDMVLQPSITPSASISDQDGDLDAPEKISSWQAETGLPEHHYDTMVEDSRHTDFEFPLQHQGFQEESVSAISPTELESSHMYAGIAAEPDDGFNSAFDAIERVISSFAPSDWFDPAWMQAPGGTGTQLPGRGQVHGNTSDMVAAGSNLHVPSAPQDYEVLQDTQGSTNDLWSFNGHEYGQNTATQDTSSNSWQPTNGLPSGISGPSWLGGFHRMI